MRRHRASAGSRRGARRADRAMAQRGESLIELLVALSIMATAVLVLLAGLGTAITMSAVHRKQAAAGTYVRAFAEALESSVAGR